MPDVYMYQYLKIKGVLIECGFLSNQEELSLLVQDDYQDSLAFGIYSGIMDYFNT